MIKRMIFFALVFELCLAGLIPTPFMTYPVEFQRLNQNIAQEYLERRLFRQCYGIDLMSMRVSPPDAFLCIISDPQWNRMVYSFGSEISNEREGKWIKAFGGPGSGNGQFNNPRGLCIDSVNYGDNEEYYVYIADANNNRIVRLLYNSQDSLLSFYDNCITSLNNPVDVSCVPASDNESFLVLCENAGHSIRIYRVLQNLEIHQILIYGSYGSGTGQFDLPSSVEIVPILTNLGHFFIYVTDSGNNRIVCLKFNGASITWEKTYEDSSGMAGFKSVTANEYFCVYVTACGLGQIWVFTPGLDELLYTYGTYGSGQNQFLYPQDICIYKDEIAVTEEWTATTGMQYFKIEPEVREIYPLSDTFDATIDSVKFNYKVCETSGYLTMMIEGQNIFQNQYHTPGTDTSPYWDGRDGNGMVVVPDTHYVYFHSPNNIAGRGVIDVKGTKIQGNITQMHWDTLGNPYVLVSACSVDQDSTLTIDPGALVMGHYESASLIINGMLQAQGAVDDSICFTAHRKLLPIEDSTYPGMWGGINIPGRNPNTRISYGIIEYASTPIFLSADSVQADFIEYCRIKDNYNAGMCYFWSAGGFGLNGNEYDNNDFNKITVQPRNYDPGILDSLIIKKQQVPFFFTHAPHRQGGYSVYGNADYAAVFKINPGTRIEVDEGIDVKIGLYGLRALMLCDGLENDTIKLVAFYKDNPYGPWAGIVFDNENNVGDTSRISYTSIEHTSYYCPALTLGDSTTIYVSDCRFFRCNNYAISMTGSNPYNNVSIIDCGFIQDSIPIISSFSDINAIGQCSYEDNKHDIIEVLAGAVHKDMIVHKQEIPYVFLNNVWIDSVFRLHGIDTVRTLTIEAGTEILCDSTFPISITIGDTVEGNRGKLMAQGNTTDLIHFEPFGQGKSWRGLTLLSYAPSDTSYIEGCYISDADSIGLEIFNSSLLMRHAKITNCNEAININGTSSQVAIDSSTITLNWCGIHNQPSGATDLNISNNEIYGNKTAIVNEVTSNNVNADSNWWGDATGPWDPTDSISGPPDCNRYGRGDSIGDYVMYRPWLTNSMQAQVVAIIQPNGGDSLFCEGNYEIKWSKTTTPVRQELYYTLDFPQCTILAGAFWQFIDTVAVSESSYVWSVPNTPSSRFRVAVKTFYDGGKSSCDKRNHQAIVAKSSEISRSELSGELLSTALVAIDISDSNSSIVDTISPQITLFRPNGGEYFIPAKEDTIKWQASDNHKLGYFDIYLSTDNGENYDVIEEHVDAPCSTYCLMPAEANSYRCKAKVVAHDSSENCRDGVSDSVFAIPIKSKINEMTAFNNAYRLRRASGASLHLVYSHKTGWLGSAEAFGSHDDVIDKEDGVRRQGSNGVGTAGGGGGPPPDVEKVYYIKSTNNGGNWFDRILMGEGIYPAMAMNSDASEIGVAWTKLNCTKVLYNYYCDECWSGVQTLLDEETDVTYSPVAIQYAGDSIHLVTLRKTIVDEDELVQDVLYLKFPHNDPYSVFMDTVDHWRICGEDDSMPRFVSLAVDYDDIPHLSWERPPGDTMFNAPLPAFDIIYAWRNGSNWNTLNISNTDDNSINPSIECYGGHAYVVWQEQIDGYCIFLYKRNYVEFPPVTETDTISQTSEDSKQPVTKKGGVILWSAGDTSEIYGRIWDSKEEKWLDIENCSNTPKSSQYPVVDAWQNEGSTYIISGWTEDTSISGYGQKVFSSCPAKGFSYLAFPSYYLRLGDSMSTPFTRYRDGVACHDRRKYDIGYDSLVYHLPYIDKQAICKVYLELYRPNLKGQSTDSSKWKIRLDIDGIMSHNLQLLPGEFKIVELTVPAAVNSDGKATIRFKKIDGVCILVRRILFYEFERNEKFVMTQYTDGCQGGEVQFNSTLMLRIYCPNPVKGILTIIIQSPGQQQTKIRLYDVTGRLVEKLFDGKINTGVNEIMIGPKNLANGVYFVQIEAGNYQRTKKIIILQ